MSGQEHLGSLRRIARAVVCGGLLASFTACSDATGPVISSVSLARVRWASANLTNYSFEVSTLTEWGPQSQYYRVKVENGVVVEVRNEAGEIVSGSASTIEQQWAQILSAEKDGALTVHLFTELGVPIEWAADREEWADDAVHVWVRNFAKR